MIERVNTTRTAAHYSDASIFAGRTLMFVSGQVPVDESGSFVPGSASHQTSLVLRNLGEVLAAAGGSFEDVLSTTVYLLSPEDSDAVRDARLAVFPSPGPASTLVYVARLAHPGFLVEISAVAGLSRGRHAPGPPV